MVVDDEPKLRDLLIRALNDSYTVEGYSSAEEATAALARHPCDLVVTDLKLPGRSGLDILDFVKNRDPRIEVIIVTGYASLDSAVAAVNLGASSYIVKPISLPAFTAHIERALAHRDFLLRSDALAQRAAAMPVEVREHIAHVTGLYELSQRLVTTLEIRDIIRTVLTEINARLAPVMCAVGVSLVDSTDLYVMPSRGTGEPESVKDALRRHWQTAFPAFSRRRPSTDAMKVTLFAGAAGDALPLTAIRRTVAIPMMVAGREIGSLTLFRDTDTKLSTGQKQLLHIVSSMAAPIIENGYIHRRIRMMAETDGLTGVANHRSFHDVLTREIARVDRHGGRFGLLMMDIDDFKKINDSFGHLTGDAVLRDLATRVLRVIRREDLLARYGGEEFAVILPDTDLPGAISLAERVRNEFASTPYRSPDTTIPYSLSIGLAIYHGNQPRAASTLIECADKALYASKEAGKNRVSTA